MWVKIWIELWRVLWIYHNIVSVKGMHAEYKVGFVSVDRLWGVIFIVFFLSAAALQYSLIYLARSIACTANLTLIILAVTISLLFLELARESLSEFSSDSLDFDPNLESCIFLHKSQNLRPANNLASPTPHLAP